MAAKTRFLVGLLVRLTMRSARAVLLLAFCAVAVALVTMSSRDVSALSSTASPSGSTTLFLPLFIRPPLPSMTQFGFDFISSAESPAQEVRYQRAQAVRQQWNRWPFYWPSIETDAAGHPGVYDWSKQDANTVSDINHGLAIDAILMLTPGSISTSGSTSAPMPRVGLAPRFATQPMDVSAASSTTSPPQGLGLPVFSDGTDVPGPGKQINQSNPWARFVFAAVNRYRPGGVLAQQQGWTQAQGIRVWEIWNEPDFDFFFLGSPTDYARLLKVAHLAARQADPKAKILFGGKANFQKPNWLADTLGVIATYPDRAGSGWFFEGVATHWYSSSPDTLRQLVADRQALDRFGLSEKTLWLNETGVPVWDDPPGPTWDPHSPYRATMQEQAAYVIQTMTWAIWMRAEAALYFQEYDDYGNGCPGADAFGLNRNLPSAGCNPGDGSARPGYYAYGVVTQYLSGTLPYWRLRPTANLELVTLQNPNTQQRIVVMWTRYNAAETVTLAATALSATLVLPEGATQAITPLGGVYNITLPAATNYNSCFSCAEASIGGMPRILVEKDLAILPAGYDAQ